MGSCLAQKTGELEEKRTDQGQKLRANSIWIRTSRLRNKSTPNRSAPVTGLIINRLPYLWLSCPGKLYYVIFVRSLGSISVVFCVWSWSSPRREEEKCELISQMVADFGPTGTRLPSKSFSRRPVFFLTVLCIVAGNHSQCYRSWR